MTDKTNPDPTAPAPDLSAEQLCTCGHPKWCHQKHDANRDTIGICLWTRDGNYHTCRCNEFRMGIGQIDSRYSEQEAYARAALSRGPLPPQKHVLRADHQKILTEMSQLHERSEQRILESGVEMYQLCATGHSELREIDPQPKMAPELAGSLPQPLGQQGVLQWIRFSENLPKKGQQILTCGPSGEIDGWYWLENPNGPEGLLLSDLEPCVITHWAAAPPLPRPAPPEEK